MHRSPETPPAMVNLGARADDLDPWSEFLSESSEEFTAPAGESAQRATDAAVHAAVDPESDADPAADGDGIAWQESAGPAPAAPESPANGSQQVPADARPLTSASVDFTLHVVSERDVPPEWQMDPEPDALVPGALAPLEDSPEPAPIALVQAAAPPDQSPPDDVRPVAPPPPVRAAAERRPISLADVLARQTPVHPAEGVAAIVELCAVIQATGGSVPDLADVLLAADGHVTVRAGARGDRDIRNLGRMLHAILSGDALPLPLRLFITSSISSTRFATAELFGAALAQYATSNRTELVRALYARALKMPPVHGARPSHAERPAWTELLSTPARPSSRKLGVAAALGTVLLAGGAFLIWNHLSGGARESATAIGTAADGLPAKDGGGVAARDDWQLGAVTPAEPEPEPERRRAAPHSVRAAANPPPVFSSAPAPVVAAPPAVPERAPVVLPPVPVRVTPQAPAVSRAIGETASDPRIYSRENYDVQPPVLLSRQSSSAALTADAAARDRNTLDLVIDERGEVMKVTLLNRPATMLDMMPLSNVKLWKFRPALRNGVPVKYRIQMTAAPAR